jgi:hypothetical protein
MSYSRYLRLDTQAAAIGSDESNVPVILEITHNDLRTVANGGYIENTDASGGASGSLTVPADFVVSPNADGSSPYDFEVIAYTASTGALIVAIEITSLSSSSDGTVYLAFGDSNVTSSQEDVAGTWGNSYARVYHLGEGGGTAYDSAGNANASDNASATGTTGKIGDRQEFDGSDDYYTATLVSAFDDTHDWTCTLWARFDDLDGRQPLVTHGKTSDYGINIGFRTGEGLGIRVYDFSTSTGLVALTDDDFNTTGSYVHLAAAYDGTAQSATLYLDNATQSGSGNVSSWGGTEALNLATDPGQNNYFFDGYMDEVRISTTARDDDWIGTQYTNQNDPTDDSTFWSAVSEPLAKTAADTLAITESLLRPRVLARTAPDTITLTESPVHITGFIKFVPDTITLTEATLRTRGRALSDTVTLTEATLRPRVMNRLADDTEALQEDVSETDTYTYVIPDDTDVVVSLNAKTARASMDEHTVSASMDEKTVRAS